MAFKVRKKGSSSTHVKGYTDVEIAVGRQSYNEGFVAGQNSALEYALKIKPTEKKDALMVARFCKSRKLDPIKTHKRIKTDKKYKSLIKSHKRLGFL